MLIFMYNNKYLCGIRTNLQLSRKSIKLGHLSAIISSPLSVRLGGQDIRCNALLS